VDTGKLAIEHDNVIRVDRSALERNCTVVRNIDSESGLAQSARNYVSQRGVIFDQ
jgi:hypothetical protein